MTEDGQQAADEGQQSADDQSVQDIIDNAGLSDDDGQQTHWMDGLGDDQFDERSAGILRRFDDVGALAKGYINAFNLVARDKIPMPQSEGEWQEVYDRLGRPKDAKDYSLSLRDELPEEFKETMSKNMDWFKVTAHELGLNATQAEKLYSRYTDFIYDQAKNQADTIESEMKEAVDTLKSELGETYEGKMTLANRAISELGGEDLISLFERTGMGRNPTVVRAFIKLGEMMAEDIGLDTSGEATESFGDLDEQIAEIQADPAYMDAQDPKHKVLVDKMAKLMQRRFPEPKQPAGTIRLF